MHTAHEFFLHELSDMLDAERRILDGLEQQAGEGANEKLQQAFQNHHEQTRVQIERLEQCFRELDEEPQDTECAGINGLMEEHDHMKEEDPSEDILDIFNATAATKVERYEITAYEALIRLADMMEHTKVSRLLKQNLREEEQTLKKMLSFSEKLKPEEMGMDAAEEEAEELDSEGMMEVGEEGSGSGGGRRSSAGRQSAAKKSSRGRRAA